MKRKPIKEVVSKIIEERRTVLRKEEEYYRDLAHANSSYWGYGGPVPRQEKAADARAKELDELDQLEQQLRKAVTLEEIKTYSFYCRECGALTITTKYPSGDWHECAACRKMVYDNHMQTLKIETPTQGSLAVLLRRLKYGWESDAIDDFMNEVEQEEDMSL